MPEAAQLFATRCVGTGMGEFYVLANSLWLVVSGIWLTRHPDLIRHGTLLVCTAFMSFVEQLLFLHAAWGLCKITEGCSSIAILLKNLGFILVRVFH